jgi:hypothetical protein
VAFYSGDIKDAFHSLSLSTVSISVGQEVYYIMRRMVSSLATVLACVRVFEDKETGKKEEWDIL